MNSVFVTAWPEKGIWSLEGSWSKDKIGALNRRISPSFKIVEFLPELTDKDKKNGVAFFKVNLHEDGSITFDKSNIKKKGNAVDYIASVTRKSHLFIVADAEDDECYGQWLRLT